MRMKIIEKFKNLKNSEKILVISKLFDIWNAGIAFNNKNLFLPIDVGIKNGSDVSRVFKFFSGINYSKNVEKLMIDFSNLTFFEKLDFMIFSFEYIYENKEINENVLINITDEINFKELSDLILKYKVLL